MTTRKMLALGSLALVLAGAAAVVATAQAVPATPGGGPAARMAVERADFGHGRHGGFGRGGGEMFLELFNRVDADGDGAVTQDEVDAFRASRVGEADASGDGALSIEEFDTLYRELTRSRMVDAFQELDADGDGTISAAELDTRLGDVVARMDRNADGALTIEDRGRRRN